MFTNIYLLVEACKSLNIDHEIISPGQNIVKVNLKKPFFFVNSFTPFLTPPILRIIKDKGYTYQLLKDVVSMPKTTSYLDPNDPIYQDYLPDPSISEIVTKIEESFALPVIVKKNTGSHGVNIFLCHDSREITSAVETVFNPYHKNYDYIALAQEYIEIEVEYRAIFLDKKLVLLYEKNIKNARFIGNLSPLHWEGAQAVHVLDVEIMTAIEKFIHPVFSVLDIPYAGFDIVVDKKGNLWLIEINSNPVYYRFIRDNPEAIAIEVFKKLLIFLMSA